MGQEFFINSQELEDKVRQLLPSQGGAGAGFDLSASTQIIPIIDLTESAEGSDVRQDLQTAFSHTSITPFDIATVTTATLVNNTGYYRVFGTVNTRTESAGINPNTPQFILNDGTTQKVLIAFDFYVTGALGNFGQNTYDFIVFLKAGDSLEAKIIQGGTSLVGCTRQIADIDGNLVNP